MCDCDIGPKCSYEVTRKARAEHRCKQFKALDDASYRCEETPDMFSSSAIGAAHPSTLEDLGEQHDS